MGLKSWVFISLLWFAINPDCFAESPRLESEKRFQNLFITAGYSTLFGAALGTAVIGLTDKPKENLSYIAMGASIGFIAGSLLETVVVFTPMIAPSHYSQPEASSASDNSLEQKTSPFDIRNSLRISPLWSPKEDRFTGLAANFTLASF